MEVPAESGGSNITQYVIDVDSVSTFSSTSLVSIIVEADELGTLYNGGSAVYDIRDLVAGTLYYVRVSAVSSVGISDSTLAANNPVAPSQHPDAPADM
ncbi:unnamed protein product, partial [Hapterophycus canaliculatus]